MSLAENSLKIVPLGGLGEIGMNCMAIETPEDLIVVDCGLYFSDLGQFSVEYIVPNFKYLLERKDKLRAFVMTHGHEDHIGALSYAFKAGLKAPIYCSAFTSLMIRERMSEAGLLGQIELKVFESRQTQLISSFKLTPIPVNHSIVEAHALKIWTPFGNIIHTGDFKFDPHPHIGQPMRWEEFEALGEEGVLLLLSDSTNIEVESEIRSEKDLMLNLERLVASAEGMLVVSTFSSNIARLGQFLELARKFQRKVVITGRSMEQNSRLALEAGYFSGKLSQLLIPPEEMDQYGRNELLVFSTGSQGEYRSVLARVSNGEHKEIKLQKGDQVILSSKFIPGNEKDISRVINNLYEQGAEVLYDAVEFVHVSGHAPRPDLERMIKAVKPKYFIPVHGEYRHLVKHAQLAAECGLKEDQVLIVKSGTVVEVGKAELRILQKWDDTRIMIESFCLKEMEKKQLKERRKLAESGAVFCLLARDPDSGKILAGPQVFLKGLVTEAEEEKHIQAACNIIRKTLDHELSNEDLQEAIRLAVRRYFIEIMGRKVTVLCTVLGL